MNRSLRNFAVAAGWGLLVVGGLRLGESSFRFWERQQEMLQQAQERMRRLQGWIEARGKVEELRDKVLGPLAEQGGNDLSWVALQGLQQAAKEGGMVVTELRPSRISGERGGGTTVRLDAKLEAEAGRISLFIRRIPELMPGVQLESLQWVPLEKGKIQMLLRLGLAEQRSR